MPRAKRPPRNDALDGLRALAIASVVLYHLSVPWLPSGHMGVVLFLVLSGYLASSTVLRTIRREGHLWLPRLWAKRIGRIWPAMAVMVVFTVALCVAFNHVLLTKLRPDLLPSLLLANNIGAILRGASYFDNLGGTSPLMHLWYLGVDIQFFLVWTALATLMCPKGRSSRVARRVAVALAAFSAVLMAVLFDPNTDPTRVYYGPDTRAFAPLLGAWLGLAWPLGGRPVRLDRARHTVRSLPLAVIAPVALVAFVAVMVAAPATSLFLYRGGMLLVAVASVLMVAGALERKSVFSRMLSLPPLKWLGTRSYGIYLWHFPLFQLFKVTNDDTPALMVAAAIALSVVAAELSLRLIDRPLSQRRLPLVLVDDPLDLGGLQRAVALIPTLLLAIGLAVGITGLMVVEPQSAIPDDALNNTGAGAAEAPDIGGQLAARGRSAGSEDAQDDGEEGDAEEAGDDDEQAGDITQEDEQAQASQELPEGSIYLLPSKKNDNDGKVSPLVIADSVAGSTDWYFDEHVPDGWLDSYVGRRPDQALSVLKSYIGQGVVGDIVVLCSFSNTPASDDLMDQLVEACGKREVYLVNAQIPNVERAQINDSVERCAGRHKNAHLIDWYTYSTGHDDWFYDDATHLDAPGQPRYIDLITNSIAEDYADAGGRVLTEEEMEAEKAKDGEKAEGDGASQSASAKDADTDADADTEA